MTVSNLVNVMHSKTFNSIEISKNNKISEIMETSKSFEVMEILEISEIM